MPFRDFIQIHLWESKHRPTLNEIPFFFHHVSTIKKIMFAFSDKYFNLFFLGTTVTYLTSELTARHIDYVMYGITSFNHSYDVGSMLHKVIIELEITNFILFTSEASEMFNVVSLFCCRCQK